MCPLVVESSISCSLFLLVVNDRPSQSHQLVSTSSTGILPRAQNIRDITIYIRWSYIYLLSGQTNPKQFNVRSYEKL